MRLSRDTGTRSYGHAGPEEQGKDGYRDRDCAYDVPAYIHGDIEFMHCRRNCIRGSEEHAKAATQNLRILLWIREALRHTTYPKRIRSDET